MLATSIVQGHGYADITTAAYTPSNVFPPGYPLLMTVVRLFTESFILQKIVNGLFLLGSAILLFFLIRKNKLSDQIAFVASAAILLNYQVLHFATMMMSEMSFLFTSVLACWFIYKIDEKRAFWKDPFFYLAIVTASYNYHIRTQGIALIAAILGYFLFTRQWKQMLGFAGGFAICLLPWMIRNKIAGLGQSRYIDMIASSNHWRPEEGTLDLSRIIDRFLDTFQMLLTKALPNSIIPYRDVNYDTAATWVEWGISITLIILIIIGMCRLGKYKYLFMFYTLATFGVISIFSTPSGNRYTTPLLPFLETSLLIGLYTVLTKGTQKIKLAKAFSPWLLISLFIFFSLPKLQELRKINKMPYPTNYQNFFQ
ncbi:glycosyltransferase family 39 protein, partial [uncultured Parabacteroides sp.]|uniref:glycosyltransferase family 39 protein n=5 Tax=uncultured Parabacteroides sp. TaxID=512312 RepID=UPI00265E6A9D